MKKFLRVFVPILTVLLIAAPFVLFGGDDSADLPAGLVLSPDGINTIEPSSSPEPLPPSLDTPTPDYSAVPLKTLTDGEFRAVWVSTVLNLDYPSVSGLSAREQMDQAIEILDNVVQLGLNAVILQARPCGDALYRSDIYPWSQYLTGTQGGDPGFDPLKFWVTEAHKRGIELHAWINPYRVARDTHDLSSLAENNPARLHPEWVVAHTDGHMYLNPGIAEVRRLVADGAREILENYDVDGLHCDDYFYPDGGLNDAATYAASSSSLTLDDWRRENVDLLVQELSDICRQNDKVFGISPFGIWANQKDNPLGSQTNGNQSYYSHFADTRKWVKSGMIDYIAPQLYWNIGFSVADYAVLLDWWADVVRGTDVKLYIGHADYRTGDSDPDSAWYGTTEIHRQLELNAEYPEVSGSIHFRYKFFVDYPLLAVMLENYHFAASLPDDYPLMADDGWSGELMVGRPYQDITTTMSSYYVIGRCDPSKPLQLNGITVDAVTDGGYFGVMVDLKNGANRLKFSQGDTVYERSITRGAETADPTPMQNAAIDVDSAYPSDADIYLQAGEKITFRCTAPIGAEVSVTIAGETFNLTPANKKLPKNDGQPYPTNFSYTYTVGSYANGKVHTVGRPVYSMTYDGRSSSQPAGGMLRCVGEGAPFYAVVSADAAFIYSKASTQGGNVGELSTGMTDYITGITGNGRWIRLQSGYWVERDYVDRVHGTAPIVAELSSATYNVGSTHDRASFAAGDMVLSTVTRSDAAITFGIHHADNAPTLVLPDGSLFSSVSQWVEDGIAWCRLTLKDSSQLDGYWLESNGNTIDLVLKRKPTIRSGDRPLDGLVIMVDAGHGGAELGAVGPMGVEFSERVIALAIAEKIEYELTALGATVVMCRTDDSTVELYDRLIHSRAVKPDLLLSVHLNAVVETSDATNIHGVSTWYREDFSGRYSATLAHHIAAATGLYDRGANQSNLYICRGTWCPSTILECGFICCPQECEWLMSDARQAAFARATADGVCAYFGG